MRRRDDLDASDLLHGHGSHGARAQVALQDLQGRRVDLGTRGITTY